jgi:hypothetical protein
MASSHRARLDALQREIADAAADALRDAAERVKARSDADIPVGDPAKDPAPLFALRERGTVEVTTDPDGRHVATVRYPGPYAAKLHEAQGLEHPRGGKPKFLEDALKAELPHLADAVAGAVRARVSRRH